MTGILVVHRAGPQVTVQDLGRPGHLVRGLSRGGAADRLAHAEGAALLGQGTQCASLELAGYGGRFEATGALRIALTGAPMPARVGDRALEWNASHRLVAGDVLDIGAASDGVYGYLSVGGGIDTPALLGSRAAHLVARIGERLASGARLTIGVDPNPDAGPLRLPPDPRFGGGEVRLVPGAQTLLYEDATRIRFERTVFVRSKRGNRQGIALDFDGEPFRAEGQRSILSDIVIPGDVQMTGDGVPFVLLPECQTTGGYPRIGSVLPRDLPIVAQAAPGAELRFRFLSIAEARTVHTADADWFARRAAMAQPMIRDPAQVRDLLGYQLISGVTSGR